MKTRKAQQRGPVVVTGEPDRRRRTRAPHEELTSPEALNAPMPGSLLVLLSRLMRSEGKIRRDGDASG